MDYREITVAENGVYYVNDTTEAVKNCSAIYVAEDTVFARIEQDGTTATDVKANFISTPGTAVKAGTLLTPPAGSYFSAITLTSGSVALILESF